VIAGHDNRLDRDVQRPSLEPSVLSAAYA
jgi:hypothetical protein